MKTMNLERRKDRIWKSEKKDARKGTIGKLAWIWIIEMKKILKKINFQVRIENLEHGMNLIGKEEFGKYNTFGRNYKLNGKERKIGKTEFERK